MFFNSIRWRLQLWYGLILLGVLAGFGLTAYELQRGKQFRRTDQDLQRRAAELANALRRPRLREQGPAGGRPPDFAGRPPPRGAFPLDQPPPEGPFGDGP